MITIVLSPVYQSPGQPQALAPLGIVVDGDVLTINGNQLDFSVLSPGAELTEASVATGCPYFVGSVDRGADGRLRMELLLPYGEGADETVRFPAPIIDPVDGVVAFPDPHWPPAEKEQDSAD